MRKKNTNSKINETNNDNSKGKQNIKKNSHTGKFNPKKSDNEFRTKIIKDILANDSQYHHVLFFFVNLFLNYFRI